MNKIKFNLSPSYINLYEESQLRFFYSKIKPIMEDTPTVQGYGVLGSDVHNCLEAYAKDNTINILELFDKYIEHHSDIQLEGFGHKKIPLAPYLKALGNGVKLLKHKYNKIIPEETIMFPLINNDEWEINIKGIIDVQAYDNEGNFVVMDYKTSSSVDSGEGFKRQGLHYCWSVWKQKGIIPKSMIFEYVKINKVKVYNFDKIDLIRYEEYMNNLAKEIMVKGTDISNYEIGEIDSPFNQIKKACELEQHKRNIKTDIQLNKIKFVLKSKGGRIYILNKMSDLLKKMLNKQFQYEDANATWIRQSGSTWDGVYRFYNEKKQSLGIGFTSKLLKILEAYCNHKNMEFDYEILEDDMNPMIPLDSLPQQLIGIDLRDEQEEANILALEKKNIRVKLPTGVGKTVLAAEFIKSHKLRTLFIVDNLDLLKQTVKEFEEVLGVKVGKIGGGECIEEWITVGTYQSVIKQDAQFFRRQQCLIVDEIQIGACKSIIKIAKSCVNTHYRMGLSATPLHASDDMKIEEQFGSIDYNFETKAAQEKGYLVASKILFYHMPLNSKEFHFRDDYNFNIVEHPIRNKFIVKTAIEKAKKGETSIILTKSVAHGKMLNDMIPDSYHIHGIVDKKIREKKWDELREKGVKVIIATLKIASKGLNIKSLDNLINAAANGNGDDSIQALGRALRLFDGKSIGTYIDFMDQGKYTKTWSRIRFKALEREGHKIEVLSI